MGCATLVSEAAVSGSPRSALAHQGAITVSHAKERLPDRVDGTGLKWGSERSAGNMSYQDIITIEPGKRGGQPCIRGMRITVYDVLSYLACGMTEQEVLSDLPELTHEDILAALSFAAAREGQPLAARD